MRERILFACIITATISVFLFSFPLLMSSRETFRNQQWNELNRQAELFRTLFADNEDPATVETFMRSDPMYHYEVYVRSDDPTVRYEFEKDEGITLKHVKDPKRDMEVAARGSIGRQYSRGVLSIATPVRYGDSTRILRISISDSELKLKQASASVLVISLTVLALVGATFIGLIVASRMARPLKNLAETASRLGKGDFRVRAGKYQMEELDIVSAALNTTAKRLEETLERSRQFSADASHQLRTPLTALRLDLEALEIVGGADQTLLEAAYKEADRLDATIEEILALADLPEDDEYFDLTELVAKRLPVWFGIAQSEGRKIFFEPGTKYVVRCRSAAISQSLQVFMDNALEHGQGSITVTIKTIAGSIIKDNKERRPWIKLSVQDEGPGFSEDAQPGRGLSLAKTLVQAEGGRIQIEKSTVSMLLPQLTVDEISLAQEQGEDLEPAEETRELRSRIFSRKPKKGR